MSMMRGMAAWVAARYDYLPAAEARRGQHQAYLQGIQEVLWDLDATAAAIGEHQPDPRVRLRVLLDRYATALRVVRAQPERDPGEALDAALGSLIEVEPPPLAGAAGECDQAVPVASERVPTAGRGGPLPRDPEVVRRRFPGIEQAVCARLPQRVGMTHTLAVQDQLAQLWWLGDRALEHAADIVADHGRALPLAEATPLAQAIAEQVGLELT